LHGDRLPRNIPREGALAFPISGFAVRRAAPHKGSLLPFWPSGLIQKVHSSGVTFAQQVSGKVVAISYQLRLNADASNS
jgi:hypothetical protein